MNAGARVHPPGRDRALLSPERAWPRALYADFMASALAAGCQRLRGNHDPRQRRVDPLPRGPRVDRHRGRELRRARPETRGADPRPVRRRPQRDSTGMAARFVLVRASLDLAFLTNLLPARRNRRPGLLQSDPVVVKDNCKKSATAARSAAVATAIPKTTRSKNSTPSPNPTPTSRTPAPSSIRAATHDRHRHAQERHRRLLGPHGEDLQHGPAMRLRIRASTARSPRPTETAPASLPAPRSSHEACADFGECEKGLSCGLYGLCVPFCNVTADCPSPSMDCRQAEVSWATPASRPSPTTRPARRTGMQSTPGNRPVPASCAFYDFGLDGMRPGRHRDHVGVVQEQGAACAAGYACVGAGDCHRWCRVGFAGDCPGGKPATPSPITRFRRRRAGWCAY